MYTYLLIHELLEKNKNNYWIISSEYMQNYVRINGMIASNHVFEVV